MAELPKLYIDNPGGDWLQRKLEQAQEDYQTAPIGSIRKNIGSSNVTGYFKTALDLSPDLLKDLPGALGEEDFRGSSVKLELLEKSIREQGYKPSPILINVREDGQPFIVEGNHRVVEALKSGRTRIPVELKYLRGAEDAEGPLSMDRLREFYGTLPKDQPRLPTSGATMADSLPVVPASTELTPVSLKSMNRSQLMNLAERMGYDGPAAGQRSIGSLFSVLHSQLGFSGIKDRSEVRFELGLTESTVDDMESAYKRGQDRFFNREGGRPEGPPTSVPMEDLETAALDLYRKGHRSGLSEPYEGARRLELKNIVEELSVRRLRTPFDIARDLKAQAGVDDTPQITGRDQPRLPPLLEGPPEEPGKKPSKGRVMRGIGSLMRGRNVFSLIQALREGYELLPEEYQVLDEALQYLKGTQFSIDKPGIESLKELLGISPEDLGETIPLPGRTSSKDTSIKQIAAVFKKPEIFDLKEGSVNLDIGGGKFDLGTDYLRNERGVENLVFDKFNRSPEHNEEVLNRIRGTGGADSATAANVLNVIEEPEARERVIQQSYDYTKDGGKVFFQVYEGSGTGVGRETTKGWQNNKKTLEYIPEIEGIFGEGSVQRKGNIIIAIKEGSSPITIPEKIDAYHGTTAEFDAFEFLHGSGGDLGFHFGTSKQAKDRLKETTQYSPPEKRAKGKILSAELTLGKTLETPDMPSFEEWNSPRSVAKLLLGTRWGKTRKKDLKRILSEADALNKSLDDRFETAIARDETLEWNPEFNRQLDRMDVQGRMHLLTELRNLLESDGYEGIKYVNKYEDPESRSYSYVVFDPANVRIKDKAKWSQNKAAGGLIDKPLYDDRRMIG